MPARRKRRGAERDDARRLLGDVDWLDGLRSGGRPGRCGLVPPVPFGDRERIGLSAPLTRHAPAGRSRRLVVGTAGRAAERQHADRQAEEAEHRQQPAGLDQGRSSSRIGHATSRSS